MTNEEKALSLSQKYAIPKNKNREIAVYQSAIEMAEWKERQFWDYLEKKRRDIEQGILHSNPLVDGDRWCGRADIINEIINELFGETEK